MDQQESHGGLAFLFEVQPMLQYWLQVDCVESSFVEKDLGVLVDRLSRSQQHPGLS